MCAIVGWAGRLKRGQWRRVHRLLSELLVASACRGTDASGFAAVDGRVGFVHDKGPVGSRSFLAASTTWRRLSYPSCLVAHCRAATHGSPHTGDNRNNHPFISERLAVIVNGIAHNYREVADEHGLPLDSECDSEVVLRLMEAHRDVPTGLDICLSELDGGMAAAVLDVRRRSVWLARNDARPAWLLRLTGVGGWFCCSTREIAEEALARTFGRSYSHTVESLLPLASGVTIELTAAGKLVAAPTSHESFVRLAGPYCLR